jgi:putative membrane protein
MPNHSVGGRGGGACRLISQVGFLRVFFFEKGAAYYFHSVPFIAKLSLFAVLDSSRSIPPDNSFLAHVAQTEAVPAVEPAKLRAIRSVIHWELAGLVVLVLCAALMARGIGYVGGLTSCQRERPVGGASRRGSPLP